MPPKVKVTKEEIILAAVEIVRKNGDHGIDARTVEATLDCSTQPVFSNFAGMDALRMAVVERADIWCQEYIAREVQSGQYPPYKASGMAYIRFAKEEKELFRLLYMRDRKGEIIPEGDSLSEQMEGMVHQLTGLSGEDVKLFHLEMWAYVHGIATMYATGFLDLEWDLVSKMITDAYQGLRKQYGMED